MEIGIITVKSPKIVARKMFTSAQRAMDVETVMMDIILDIMRIEEIDFHSEGRRGGGSWARLKPDTVRKRGNSSPILRRIDTHLHYGDDVDEDSLFKSVTQPDAPFQILKTLKNGFDFGTTRPYAKVHQEGGGNKGKVPARPFLRFLPEDERRWAARIAGHIVLPFRDNK